MYAIVLVSGPHLDQQYGNRGYIIGTGTVEAYVIGGKSTALNRARVVVPQYNQTWGSFQTSVFKQ